MLSCFLTVSYVSYGTTGKFIMAGKLEYSVVFALAVTVLYTRSSTAGGAVKKIYKNSRSFPRTQEGRCSFSKRSFSEWILETRACLVCSAVTSCTFVRSWKQAEHHLHGSMLGFSYSSAPQSTSFLSHGLSCYMEACFYPVACFHGSMAECVRWSWVVLLGFMVKSPWGQPSFSFLPFRI